MTTHADRIRLLLASGPLGARQLVEKTGLSQPTLSRTITALGDEVVRIGAARSIQYTLRDAGRGLGAVPVYRVSAEGQLQRLGELVPVRPDGYVMCKTDGTTRHSDSLPWWLLDMRPQGFLGRAYAARHADALGLPRDLAEWNDSHMLRALLAHGHDAVGNLLLGDVARADFLAAAAPTPIAWENKGEAYQRLAQAAARGDLPGSSAGGEQPKFTSLAQTPDGPRHMLVKFTLPDANPVTERWRDLLLAEYHALTTLRAAHDGGGCVVSAARACVIDHAGQRFLELERFDRVGVTGRQGLVSLASVEAEWVGDASARWPTIATRLAQGGHITAEAATGAALLYAYGTLIGNTDMHHGNLSFLNQQGRPYALAPAYDMLPMAFAPRASGGLRDDLAPALLHPSVPNAIWAQALALASDFLSRLQADERWSARFAPCIASLSQHITAAGEQVARLG